MHGRKVCGFETDQEEDMSPANDFPSFLISMSNLTKMFGTKRHIVPESNTFYLRIRNKSKQKFFESHETNAWGHSSIRVQPERKAALGQSEIFKKNPAVAAAGP
jgi:hypothetical protein